MADPLVILSGLPGTGKTRLANQLSRQLHIPTFSKDRFQSQLRVQGIAGREGVEGYELVFDIADQQLSLGIGAILDAVFPKRGFRLRAAELAEFHGVPLRPIYCYCSDHDLWQARLKARDQFVPSWTPVGWQEVEKLSSYFEPWLSGSALHLDAVQDFKINLSRALAWITGVKEH